MVESMFKIIFACTLRGSPTSCINPVVIQCVCAAVCDPYGFSNDKSSVSDARVTMFHQSPLNG